MPCPPRTSHGRHAAGSRSSSSQALVQLPSTRPIPRGAVQVTQAVAARYIVLWRVIRVVDRRALVIDSAATFRAPVLVGRWTRLRARLALTSRLSAQNGRQMYLASSRPALTIRAFALMISIYLLSVGMPDLAKKRAPDTASSARGQDPSLPAWRLPASEGPVSRRHISHGSRA